RPLISTLFPYTTLFRSLAFAKLEVLQRTFVQLSLIFNLKFSLTYTFFTYLNFQTLNFYLFRDGVVFAIVFYLIKLSFIFLYSRLSVFNHVFTLNDRIFQII